MNLLFIKSHFRLLVLGFFVFYFLLGIFIHRDYGISWDEPTSRDNGLIAYQYVTKQNNDLLTYHDRDYGTAFELPLVYLEKTIGVTTSQQIYYLRHFVTFLFFFTAIIFFYQIALTRFNPGIAFTGVLFLFLSPRIFADSFYNSKDIALLSGMTIAIFTLIRFLKKPSFTNILLHAMACAYVVDIRLPGLIIVPITVGFFVMDTLLLVKRRLWRHRIAMLAFFLLLCFGFVVLFWPYLWSNPVGNFLTAFSNFSHFVRLSDTVLYMGNYGPDKYVPWHYPLVWIGISTPLIYIVFLVAGFGVTAGKFLRRISAFYKNCRNDLLFYAWFFTPLLMIIGLNSTLYDGWRHLYFIYPALILTALIGLEGLLAYAKKHSWLKVALLVLALVNLTNVLRFMIYNHPYQNLYFNELVGGLENAKQKFEMDYWGLTFREGLEYIAAHDRDSNIPVFFAFGHLSNPDILKDQDKNRFKAVRRPQEAKYILNNFRWYKDRNNYRWDSYIYTTPHPTFYTVTVDGVEVMTILKPNYVSL